MFRLKLFITFFFAGTGLLFSQMWNGVDTLYGNEWIDYDQEYLKIKILEDGVYRINFQILENAGIPLDQIKGKQFQIFNLGNEVPIYVSNEEKLNNSDFIEFVAEKNRSEIDRYLFLNPDSALFNHQFSMFSDTASYYLTWTSESSSTNRLETIQTANSNLPNPESSCDAKQQAVFSTNHIHTTYFDNLVAYSIYDKGEGFGSSFQVKQTVSFDPVVEITPSTEANLRILMMTNGSTVGHDLIIRINGAQFYQDSSITSYNFLEKNFKIPSSLVEAGLEIEIEGQRGNNDRYSVSVAELKYSRNFNTDNISEFKFSLPASTERRAIEVVDFDQSGSELPVLFDIANKQRVLPSVNGTSLNFELQQGDSSDFLLINPDFEIKLIDSLIPVSFQNYVENNTSDYLIITHSSYIDDASKPIEAYVEYRQSAEGGGYKVSVLEIDQLYDQFAYGISGHPISIRNFSHLFKKTNPEISPVVFLVGKGIEYHNLRNGSDELRQLQFVPTFGTPGSDNLLFSSNSSEVPIFSYGRLAATDATDIFNYLNKVKVYEASLKAPRTVEDLAWRKRVLHLSGGDLDDQAAITGAIKPMTIEAENGGIAAEVSTFRKVNSAPVATSVAEGVITAVNEGVAIKTFFGHGGVTVTDFGLDDPNLFTNQTRYPVIFSLGCLTGNLFTSQESVSEKFLLSEEKGAVAYIASSGFGFPSALSASGTGFYELFGDSLYHKTIGEANKTIRGYFDDVNSVAFNSLNQQMSFHGDPVLKLNLYDAPDFTIDQKTISHFPQVLNTLADSVEIKVELVNLGKVSDETTAIEIQHELPNGVIKLLRDTIIIDRSFFQYNFKLPLNNANLAGDHKIRLKIDPDNSINEMPAIEGEQNNSIRFTDGRDYYSFFVLSNDVLPVYPPDFGIVSDSNLVLTASPSDAFEENIQTFIFQIDTTAEFNSSLLSEEKISQKNGVIKWIPDDFQLVDQKVYYWRVAVDTTASGNKINWNERSFIYKKDVSESGWHQSDFEQLNQNEFSNLLLNDTTENFEYTRNVSNAIGEAMVLSPTNNSITRFLLNNNRVFRGRFNFAANLSIIVIDPVSGKQWFNEAPGRFGSVSPGGTDKSGFVFDVRTPAARKKVMDVLQDSIPAGHYVTIMTFQRDWGRSYNPEQWAADSTDLGTNLFQIFEKQGAQRIRELEQIGSVPYAFAYIKDERPLDEAIAANKEEVVTILFDIPGFWDSGNMISKVIGPAKSWQALKWEHSDILQNDTFSLTISGLSERDSIPMVLAENVTDNNFDLDFIDPLKYPFLKLDYYSMDTTLRTPGQLDFWEVLYDEFADGAIQANEFYTDTIQQGAQLKFKYAIQNTSQRTVLDSSEVQFVITTSDNEELIEVAQVNQINAGSMSEFDFEFDTKQIEGQNTFRVEFNPEKSPRELSYLNNIGIRRFFVKTDRRSPLLDVTFDGVHIVDGDIISPKPFILMTLRDENPYFILNDTSLFTISLKTPDGTLMPIDFNSSQIEFFPADSTSGNNKARIEFQPELIVDGEYELTVNGKDGSGNEAGVNDYKVRFKIITESSISNFLPYPNPFSTATRFVYTMTGTEEPVNMKIQILTVSGRVVREITKQEFGMMKVGTHTSDFVWNGTDEFGDLLANGVYLYRVVTEDAAGKAFKAFETGADSFFKKGFGKIVILR